MIISEYPFTYMYTCIQGDLSWGEHVAYTIGRVKGKIWQLVRLKNMQAPIEKLLEFYILKIRSILMFGAACFHFSLTDEQSSLLETQQKRCLATIRIKNVGSWELIEQVGYCPAL